MSDEPKQQPVSPARIQDGTIEDATDFWQLIQDVGYLIEGENRSYEREQLHWLDECLNKWFATHPEIGAADADLHQFAVQSAARLVHAFVFNDRLGADAPDFRQRTFDRMTEALGLAAEGAVLIEDKIAAEVLDAVRHGRTLDQQVVDLITSPDQMASVGLALIRAILKDYGS